MASVSESSWLRAGAAGKLESSVPLEAKDLERKVSLKELRAWLGPQACYLDECLAGRALDLIEYFADEGNMTLSTRRKGGLAIVLGLKHGQDFRRAFDRLCLLALIDLCKPRHIWGAFPCTAFCAWVRLNIARGCDMTSRTKEGRVFLHLAMQASQRQRVASRMGHLENPLPSLAWREPEALAELSHPVWLRARLDQCRTQLTGPEGGLHKKPTLIRTTDPAMREALDLQCSGDHAHEPVQGKATALSATYTRQFADIAAKVIMGGGQQISGLLLFPRSPGRLTESG